MMTLKLSLWTAVHLEVDMTVLLLWKNQRRVLYGLLQNLLTLKRMSLRQRAARINRRERGAKRGEMADSVALASTPQLLPGHQRGIPSENHLDVRGPESVIAAHPLAARPERAAGMKTRTGTGIETILGEIIVVKGGGEDLGVVLGPGHVLDHDPERGATDESAAQNGHPPESTLLRGGTAGVAGDLGRPLGPVARDGGTMAALDALKMVCLRRVPQIVKAGQKTWTVLQTRVAVKLMAGVGTPVATRAGKTSSVVVETKVSHGPVEASIVVGAQGGVALIVVASKKKQLRTAGSTKTTQVQQIIQGMTHTAASMTTGVEAGGKSLSQESLY